MTVVGAIIKRDVRLAFRRRSELVNPLLFLVMVITLFPLGMGPDPERLREIAPAVVWIAALLAAMMSLSHLMRDDYDDGSLELILISGSSPALVALAKVAAHWLTTGLPIALLAPILAMLYGLETNAAGVLGLTMLLGTPTLSLVGGIAVALTIGLKRGGMFLALLVLPLYIPVLIFATAAVVATTEGLPAMASILMVAALLVLALSLAPFAIGAALRLSLT